MLVTVLEPDMYVIRGCQKNSENLNSWPPFDSFNLSNQVFPIFLHRRSVAIIILCYRSDFALRGRIRPIGGLPYKASILNHNRLNRFIGLVIGKSHRPSAILVFANASVIYLLYFEVALHWFECKENHVALKKVKVF